jgi:hypothetical protein
MRLVRSAAPLLLVICLSAVARAQTSGPIATPQGVLQAVSDSAWIRASSAAHGRREARLLAHSATEFVLDLKPQPLRLPATSIDSVWERRTASKTGALVGGLLGAGIGILIATQAVEEGETPGVDYVALFAIGGVVGGGLLGALVGRAFPKWHRHYPR